MQNKPNVKDAQINVNSYMKSIYEKMDTWLSGKNKPNSNPNKPNLQKAKMNVNLTLTKDYRKKDDFIVRINKPNFFKGQKWAPTYMLERIMNMKPPSGPKKQTQSVRPALFAKESVDAACPVPDGAPDDALPDWTNPILSAVGGFQKWT